MELCYANNPKSLFRKYAKLVTWFANTQLGRDYLQHKNLFIPNERLGLLLPNGYIRTEGKLKHLTVTTRPVYASKLYPALYAIDALQTNARDSLELLYWMLGLRGQPVWATNTLYSVMSKSPDAHPESTSVDGSIYRNTGGQTWAQIIVGTTSTSADDTTTTNARFPTCQKDGASSWDFYQWFVNLYDISAIGSTSLIVSGGNTVKFYGQTKTSTGPTISGCGIVISNPASNTALAGSDYPSKTLTRQATDIARASWATGAYNTFTFNSTGDATIDAAKAGILKLGLVAGNEIDASSPSGGTTGQSDLLDGYAAGGTYPPQVDILYMPVSTQHLKGRRRQRIDLSGVSAG